MNNQLTISNGIHDYHKKHTIRTQVIAECTAKYILDTNLDTIAGTIHHKINEYGFNENVDVLLSLKPIQYFQSSDTESKIEGDAELRMQALNLNLP